MFIQLPTSNRLLNTDQITIAKMDFHGKSEWNPGAVLHVKLADGTDELFKGDEGRELWTLLQSLAQNIAERQ